MLILYYVFKIVICNVIKVALPTLFTVLCCGGSACVVNKKKKKQNPNHSHSFRTRLAFTTPPKF